MVDHVSSAARSIIMRAVKSRDTKPEIIVRKAAHRLGLRFRLYDKKLPGTPDIVFAKWKTVVFVHGCFWHRHPGCKKVSIPKKKLNFWIKKFDENVRRDQENVNKMSELGWAVFIIWQCEITSVGASEKLIKKYFNL